MQVHPQATLEGDVQLAHERLAPVLSTVIYHLFLLVLLLFSCFYQ